jgi:hypothetical protein
LTSDLVGLGESDANARWIGVRRHQAILIILSLGLVGDWLLVPHASAEELVVGIAALCGAAPVYDGLTVSESALVVLRYALRGRWSLITTQSTDAELKIAARGVVVVRGFELLHRGRLDLSGADLALSARLVDLVKGMATTNEVGHLSIHVRSIPGSANTLMTVRANGPTPEGWTENPTLLREFTGLRLAKDTSGVLERWNYVRSEAEVLRTFRVSDFSGASAHKALLEKLQQSPRHPEISLHVEVLPSSRAHRVASRAVHQLSSDNAASSAVGFRRSARSKRSLRRLTQREDFVANGDALLRIGVFVTVRAQSRASLREASKDVIRSAEESGLRLQRGAGRQVLWHCLQLPGGPGW